MSVEYTAAEMEQDIIRLCTTKDGSYDPYRLRVVIVVGKQGPPDLVSGALLVALSSREANCRNITGGAEKNPDTGEWIQTHADRGCFMLNEVYNKVFLESVEGCTSGNWQPTEEDVRLRRTALTEGCVPRFTHAARRARDLIDDNVEFYIDNDVKIAHCLELALDAYNRGRYPVLSAYKEGGLAQAGSITVGGNYGADVIHRRTLVNANKKFKSAHAQVVGN